MRKKIVLLQVTPVFPALISKWCIDELVELNCDTVILDVSPVVKPEVDKHLKQPRLKSCPELRIEYKRALTRDEVELFFESNRELFFFTMFYNLYEERMIYHLLWKYNIRYANLSGISSELGIDDEIVEPKFLDKLHFKYMKAVLYNRVLRKIFPYKKPDYIALSARTNEEYQCKLNMCQRKVKRVYLHSYDYENYLRAKAYDRIEKPYCVFLDSFVPFHPDFVIDGKIRINPEDYYRELNMIFNFIKKKLGLDIIIAAHPRADIEIEKKYFPNWVVEYGKTSNLVKSASLIVSHFSSSIAFGIMANKPIVIIDNPALSAVKSFDAKCKKYSEFLNLKLIRKADEVNSELLAFNSNRYRDFLLQKITYEIKETPDFWEQLLNNISI